jgi:hypothetical protein
MKHLSEVARMKVHAVLPHVASLVVASQSKGKGNV